MGYLVLNFRFFVKGAVWVVSFGQLERYLAGTSTPEYLDLQVWASNEYLIWIRQAELRQDFHSSIQNVFIMALSS